MKIISLFTAVLSLLMLPVFSVAYEGGISELYKKYGIEGALIIASLDGKSEYLHNPDSAKHRYLPASTFKIPNTLIALKEGIIKNDEDIIKWDGNDKGLNA